MLTAIINNIPQIVGSLVLLTPLIRALHKWHIDIRKTARPADAAVSRQRN